MKRAGIIVLIALLWFIIGLLMPRFATQALHCEYDRCVGAYCVDSEKPTGCDATMVEGCRTYDCEVVVE